MAVGREAAEDGILAVIGQYLCPFSPIVFLQLRQRLDDRHHSQPTGAACTEQRQDVEGGHGPQLVAEEHNTTRQPSAVFIRHGEQLPCQRLDHQACHEIFGLILLRQDQEDSGLLRRKPLGVHGAVKTQHLLQLGVQKGVEARQYRAHDRGHGLVGCVQRRPGKPPCLVLRGQLLHEDGKPVFAPHPRWSQQFLHQLEHGHDVPPLLFPIRRQKFCQQEHHGSQQALCGIVEIGVLAVVRIPIR